MQTFSLFIGIFYFLYVLFDYSIHSKAFQNPAISSTDIFFYYLHQFSKRAEMLVPIAMVLSAVKVLTTSNLRNEIVALSASGIPLKKIMHPFLCVALLASAALFINFEYLQPQSITQIARFEEHYFKKRAKKDEEKKVNALILKDNSLLIYQRFEPEKQAFFDVFWLKNENELSRIQWLFPYEKTPLGKNVDSLIRTEEGEYKKMGSSPELVFPDMNFDADSLFDAMHPPHMQSLSELARHLRVNHHFFHLTKMNVRQAEAATFFYLKSTLPLVSLLGIIAIAPFCLKVCRNLSVFVIYALSLAGIIVFFMCLNASIILGKTQLLPPLVAILVPQSLFFITFGWKYAKL